MSLLFSIKKGAELPSVEFSLDSPIEFDLDEAETVKIAYRKRDAESPTRVVADLEIVSAAEKTVRMPLTPELVSEVAVYQCQVEIVFDVAEEPPESLKTMVIPQIDFDEFHITATIE